MKQKILAAIGVFCALSSSAMVTLDDTWAEGIRTNQNLPYQSAWFGNSSTIPTISAQPNSLFLTNSSTQSRIFWTFFTTNSSNFGNTNGMPIQLDYGQTLQATFIFVPHNVIAITNLASLRIGLLDYESVQPGRISSDSSTISTSGTNVMGYMAWVPLVEQFTLDSSMNIFVRENINNLTDSGDPLGKADVFQQLGLDSLANTSGFSSGITYTFQFSVTRSVGGNIISSSFTGNGMNISGSVIDTSGSDYHRFDTFMIRDNRSTETADVFECKELKIEVLGANSSTVLTTSPGTFFDNGYMVSSLTPTFGWNSVVADSRYALYISQYPYGSANIVYYNTTLTGASFQIPAGFLQNNTKYRWNMTWFDSNGNESDVSDLLYFQTPPLPFGPVITTQPQGQTVQVGSNANLTVTATGYPSPNYQWYFNSNPLTGQTAASLSLNNVQLPNGGAYSVAISNAYGSAHSATAQLIVYTNLVLIQTNRTPPAAAIGPPTIPTNPNYFKVFTNGNFQSGIALNPNKNTVILTHGWNSSSTDWPQDMAQLIQQRIGVNAVNIVAWDWTADAQSDFLHLTQIADKTQGEGFALGTNLVAALGANYTQRIHFVGHSLGTLVNAAAANYLHTHGFSWTNTQMTLCDEAEIAGGIGDNGLWQFTTTLPNTIVNLTENFSTSQPYWSQALPNQFAWADNYVSFCGLLHTNAANAILTYTYPGTVGNISTLMQEFYNFHDYAHYFYEDTIEPSIFNTGGATNATFMGFICSFEGNGFASRPDTNTFFFQDPNGLELNLVQTNYAFATSNLNARVLNFIGTAELSVVGEAVNNPAEAVGKVTGLVESGLGMIVNLITSAESGSLVVKTPGMNPLGGPVPNGSSANNTPAYAWIPLSVPSSAVSMSFDFMLQGNGNNDSFQAALNGTNILSLETSLIQTNVAMNSGLINLSQYAGTNVELFLGIVGGTSTNAQLTVSDVQFYSAALPALQAQVLSNKVIASWPLSASGFTLQTSTNLTAINSWTTVTNTPAIANLQNVVTNSISGTQGFYRLIQPQ